MADTIPEVLDDCRSLADPSGREYSVAVDARVAYFEQGQAARALLHTEVVPNGYRSFDRGVGIDNSEPRIVETRNRTR